MRFDRLLEHRDHRTIVVGVRLVDIAGTAHIDNVTPAKDTCVVFASEVAHQRVLLGRPESFVSTMSEMAPDYWTASYVASRVMQPWYGRLGSTLQSLYGPCTG